MIRPLQTLIPTRDLTALIRFREKPISRATVCLWAKTDPAFKACQFRRGWWSVPKLKALGVLS